MPAVPSPTPPPAAVYADAAQRAGESAYGLLLAEQAWIHRRVETIDMLSTQFVRRTVSVDFTVPQGIRKALRLGNSDDALVPLATLAKRPLRNFDLRDEAGNAVAVLGRDHNGPLAYGVLLGVTRRSLLTDELSDELTLDLRRVARQSGDDARKTIEGMLAAAHVGDKQHNRLLRDPAAFLLLADLAENYVLVAICDDIERRRILKFSYEEPLVTAKPSIRERLGWTPLAVELEAPGAPRAASYHAEIVVPEELRFDWCVLYDQGSGMIYGEDVEADRAAIHVAHLPLGARTTLLFRLCAERVGVPVAGAVIAWATALLLLAGAAIGDFEPNRSDPAVSVVLAALAVFAGVVARSGEHRLVQSLFAGPRLLLLASAFSALAATAALAYGVPSETLDIVWRSAAGVALLIATALTITMLVARPIVPGERQ